MASLGQHFNAEEVEPSAPRADTIPPGDYKAEIVRSEMKDTSKGGQMLELEMSITDGAEKNRRIFDRLNLVNSNPTAQQIAHQTLSAICRATGQMQVSDSEQLHFKPMTVKVAVKEGQQKVPGDPSQGKYPAQNVVKGYSAANGTTRGAGAPSYSGGGQTSAAPAPTAGGTPAAAKTAPWRKAG